MISLQTCDEGLLLPVKAQAGARRNLVRDVRDGYLKVSVTQIAERGKANEAIRRQLAKTLGLRLSQIELHSGATSSFKKFLIRDVTRQQLAARLADRTG